MLTTKRLNLRSARASDLDDLFAIFSDPNAMRYWSTPPHPDRTRTSENLARMMPRDGEQQTRFVIEKAGGVIGTAGMSADSEVGFLLHPDHWRQGIVTEAMRAIIPYLFAQTDVCQLTADVDPRNAASVGLLRSLGFYETHRAERTYDIAGEWSDSVYFALDRPES